MLVQVEAATAVPIAVLRAPAVVAMTEVATVGMGEEVVQSPPVKVEAIPAEARKTVAVPFGAKMEECVAKKEVEVIAAEARKTVTVPLGAKMEVCVATRGVEAMGAAAAAKVEACSRC